MELSGAMATNADIHPNSHPLPHQKERESDTTLIKMEAGNNRRSRGGKKKKTPGVNGNKSPSYTCDLIDQNSS